MSDLSDMSEAEAGTEDEVGGCERRRVVRRGWRGSGESRAEDGADDRGRDAGAAPGLREAAGVADRGGRLGRSRGLQRSTATAVPRLRAATASGESAGTRISDVGAVLGDQRVGLDAVLVRRVRCQLLKAQPVLVAGDLGAVRGVHHRVELGGDRRHLGAHRLERLGAARARRLGLGAPLGRDSASDDSAADTAEAAPAATARATDAWAARCLRRTAARSLAARSAAADAASESARPLIARSRSSTVRTSRRASISAFARRRGPLGQLLALLVGLLRSRTPGRGARSSSASASASSSFSWASLAWSFSALRCAAPTEASSRLASSAAARAAPGQPAEPPGDLRRGRVHGAHPAADLLKLLPGVLLRLGRLGERLGRRLARPARPRPAWPPPRRPRRARRAATAPRPTRRAPSARRSGRRRAVTARKSG